MNEKTMKELIKTSIEKSISYDDYRSLVTDLVAKGLTTGPNQSEGLTEFTKLNNHRMKRLEKTVHLEESLLKTAQSLNYDQTWILLTEGWCGDAAQIAPIINKIAESSERINLRILLRDDNLELMDKFLTNNGRSIPKLIIIENQMLQVLGDWGPRPAKAQKLFEEIRYQKDIDSKKELQNWYNQDKGVEIQKELRDLLESLIIPTAVV